jgi:hypothetical protein
MLNYPRVVGPNIVNVFMGGLQRAPATTVFLLKGNNLECQAWVEKDGKMHGSM